MSPEKILDTLTQAVVVTDPAGRIVYWNPYAEKLSGWSAEELREKGIGDIAAPGPVWTREVLKQVRTQGQWTGGLTIRRKDGAALPVFAAVTAVPDEKGRPSAFVGFSREAPPTDREIHYDALFRHMSEGFAICEAVRGADGRLVDFLTLEVNPAMQRMLGSGLGVAGRSDADTPAQRAAWLAMAERVLDGEPERIDVYDARLDRWYDIHLSHITGDRLGQFCFDITARKEAEQRQVQLFDELNHRVRNNLTLVVGFLSLQAREAEPVARSQLLKAVDRVHSIADVHASLYRGARREDVELAAYIHKLCSRLGGSLLEGERVTLEVTADTATVALDTAIALGMIVNELVSNAAKHAFPPPLAGRVTVHLEASEDELLLTVEDTGVGATKITSTRRGGLGMKLVRALTRQIGGDLRVRHGQGAAFQVRLPRSAPPTAH